MQLSYSIFNKIGDYLDLDKKPIPVYITYLSKQKIQELRQTKKVYIQGMNQTKSMYMVRI